MQILPPVYKRQNGLTLIEVLIAMALLAFISILIYQATVKGFEINYKLNNESNDYMTLTISLSALESDIGGIYAPNITFETPPENTTPSLFWSAPMRIDGMRRTRFTGARDKITFVSSVNHRIQQDSPESDLVKITWGIERNNSGAYSLYRIADTDVFNYEDARANQKSVPRTTLFENLSSAKFSFYKKETSTWEDSWDSESQYIKLPERYPEMIRLRIELPDPTNSTTLLTWEGTYKPNATLNPSLATPAPTTNTNTTTPRSNP